MEDLVQRGGRYGQLAFVVGGQHAPVLRRLRDRRGIHSNRKSGREPGGKCLKSGGNRTLPRPVRIVERPYCRRLVDVCPRPQHARGLPVERSSSLRTGEVLQVMSNGEIAGGRCGKGSRFFFLALGFTAALCASARPGLAQARDDGSSDRKIVARVEPEYPETLKRLYIGGVVKIEAVVAPTGVVESTQLLGGSPVLGQSAMKAIKHWRYAPASSKEKVIVQMEFDPHR